MTDLLQHLRNFLAQNSFQALYEMYGIAARPCKNNSKWSLNYDQIASKPGCLIAGVCRGLIVRPIIPITSDSEIVGDVEIVARPMDRFYNAGEPHAAHIDWSTARCQEKLDGTMILLYWDDVKNEWCVATRSVPEADVSFGDFPGSPLKENTFAELFWYSLEKTLVNVTVKTFLDSLSARHTFIFELTSPLNRVVVKYDDYVTTVLAVRNNQTGEYLDTSSFWELPCVDQWRLQSLSDLVEFVNKMDPAKCEGAVVVDANWNRIKVKNKAWVLASRAKDILTMSKRNALECIINGQADDVVPLLDPHVAEYITRLQSNLHTYRRFIDDLFARFKMESTNRKEFALRVQASGEWQSPFFALYSGNYANCLDWLRTLSKNGKLTPTMLDTILTYIDTKE